MKLDPLDLKSTGAFTTITYYIGGWIHVLDYYEVWGKVMLFTHVCHSVHGRGWERVSVWCHFLSGCLVLCSFSGGGLCLWSHVPSVGLCPGEGVSVQEVLSRGDLCPERGLCPEGFCPGGLCPGGVSVLLLFRSLEWCRIFQWPLWKWVGERECISDELFLWYFFGEILTKADL